MSNIDMSNKASTSDTAQQTVAQAIDAALTAARNCHMSGNKEWLKRWTDYLTRIARECLPSGGGFDNGTRILEQTRDGHGFVLIVDFHHMNDTGFYDGWTEYRVTVRPAFSGLRFSVEGRDYNGTRDYIVEVLDAALQAPLPASITP